jgi:hypothetical protein
MKFNRSIFFRVFAVLTIFEVCLLLTACTGAWLTTVSGMLPSILAIVNAIVAFAAGLQSKTVSSATYSAIQKWQQNVATEIAAAQAILAAIKQNATAGLIGDFQAAMQAIVAQFNNILSGLDITDTATVAKLTQFLSLGVAAISAVLALIPMALAKVQAKASKEELKHYDALAAKTTTSAINVMKETYVAIIDEHTANADVNASLDALPRTI